MPRTALQHFEEDIRRARALYEHANHLSVSTAEEQLLRTDVLRSSWMLAVGALDAYFCDAYTDIVAATIISKSRVPSMVLPDFFYEIRFPVRAILEPYTNNVNWRWRMAARKMMERETVLSLGRIQNLFNAFFRQEHRFFQGVLDDWIVHPDAKTRLFGTTPTAYLALPANQRRAAIGDAWAQMQDRYRDIFQRRHDCIHNCDRPRVSLQPLNRPGTVLKVIQDVEFLVYRCDEHIQAEFRQFLLSIGCTAALARRVGY